MLKIRFLYHSAFLLETDSSLLLFDAYRTDFMIPEGKKLFVFSSHFHQDHFSPDILFLDANEFFISSTARKKVRGIPEGKLVTFVSPDRAYERANLTVMTFQSTDCGVCFFIETEGRCIYFAGDNNAWLTGGENDEAMKKRYMGIIRKLPKRPEIAFIPADPHLKENFDAGSLLFARMWKPDVLIPMHFWNDFSIPQKLCESFTKEAISCRIPDIRQDNSIILEED